MTPNTLQLPIYDIHGNVRGFVVDHPDELAGSEQRIVPDRWWD